MKYMLLFLSQPLTLFLARHISEVFLLLASRCYTMGYDSSVGSGASWTRPPYTHIFQLCHSLRRARRSTASTRSDTRTYLASRSATLNPGLMSCVQLVTSAGAVALPGFSHSQQTHPALDFPHPHISSQRHRFLAFSLGNTDWQAAASPR
jgi:hypothetical protein